MNLFALITEKRVARNTSVLMAAQIVTYASGVVYIALLARYVGTEGVGTISTAIALTGMLVLIVGPGLNTLLVRDIAADKAKAGQYATNMLFLKCLLAVPFVILTLSVARIAGYPEDTVLIIQVYVVVYLFDTLGQIPAALFQAFERMEYEASTQIVRSLANVSLSLLAIALRMPLLNIVMISALAEIGKFVLMVVIMRQRFNWRLSAVSLRAGRRLFRLSLPFGVLTILFVAQTQIGIFILSLNYPAETVGIYSAALAIITMVLIVSSAFSTAILPTFSALWVNSKRELRSFYRLCYKYLLVVGFPLGLIVMLVAEDVVLLIYGEEFRESVIVLRIMALFLFTLVGLSNGPLLSVTGKQKFFAWTQSVSVGINAILTILLVPKWGPLAAAIGFVSAGMVTFVVHSIASHRTVGLSIPWSTAGKVILATFLMGVVTAASLSWGLPWMLAAFVVAPSTYLLFVLLLGVISKTELTILASAPSPELKAEGRSSA